MNKRKAQVIKMKKKKVITMVAAVALVAIVGVASTFAYITDSESVQNVITFGNVNISLDEPSFPEEGVTDVVPNQTIAKDPTITVDKDSNDAYVRAAVEVSFVDADGNALTITKDGKDVTEEYKAALQAACEATMTSGWTKGTDGYYYYNTELSNADSAVNSAVLFESVTVPAAWGNEIANVKFVIDVTAEAIQADNLADDVLTYDENNNIVSWDQVTVESFE